ncbi:heavy metal-associated isoprenylated plant protein 37-like [Andrographis paniculata]|uniref:heavy metal-associated isoprenylated plant protein 37-like n=1 Tax=Andrographis paniculata TaxID=175694 RepID=UPI0021E6F26A|nr:heavy metal-associated isoprenylated plant protein 37-like [Andrographis paniculata]
MTKDEDYKLLKIQTCVLRVNIHCEGCKQKVKKLLHRTEGVYQVNIDVEQQKVTVSGSVDSASLIKKLGKGGKHAELWSQKNCLNQIQKHKDACNKDDGIGKGTKLGQGQGQGQGQKGNLAKGLEALKCNQKFPSISDEDDEYVGTDDDGDDDYEFDEEDMQVLFREKLNQLAMAEAAKKGVGAAAAAGATSSNAAVNGGAGKKGNCNQNGVGKPGSNSGGIHQKTLAALQSAAGNRNGGGVSGEGKIGNDINAVLNLAGFHGNGGAASHNPAAAAMMMNMDGNHQAQYINHPSSLMMMNRPALHPPPPRVMSYNMSPSIPPTTGYYYNYGHVGYGGGADHHSSAGGLVFADDDVGACSIM